MSLEPIDVDLYHPRPLLIVLSGVSGVGKDSVLQEFKDAQGPYFFVVTATTRPPRPTEKHGVDYFFLSMDEFQSMIDHEELIEYALVYKDYKGIPRQQVIDALASGKDVMVRVDVQGAARIRSLFPEAVLIFLVPSSEQEWMEQLRNRKTETPEALRQRIETARQELTRIQEFDYVVVNQHGCLEKAVKVIEAIIQAEHHRIRGKKSMTYSSSSQPPDQEQAAPPTVSVSLPSLKPVVTFTIIAVTVLVYLLQYISTSITGDIDWPLVLGAKINQYILQGQLWRLFTPALLHGSVIHILFNMYALYSFGPSLERSYGHWRFLALYLLGAFGGNVLSFILSTQPSVGSSTAIFGLVAAEGVFIYQNRRFFGDRTRSMILNTLTIVGINLFIGFTSTSIDNWGHLGGLLAGFLFAWFAGPVWTVQGMGGGLGLMPSLRVVDTRPTIQAQTTGLLVLLGFTFITFLRFLSR